jgi:hypothetical protein
MPPRVRVITQKEWNNIGGHEPHLRILRHGTKAEINEILRTASPAFIRALASMTQHLYNLGYRFVRQHRRRAEGLMSRNKALRTKKKLVSGEPGKGFRGAGFFSSLAHAFHKATDWLGGAAKTIGHTIEGAADSVASGISGVTERLQPAVDTASQAVGTAAQAAQLAGRSGAE